MNGFIQHRFVRGLCIQLCARCDEVGLKPRKGHGSALNWETRMKVCKSPNPDPIT